LSKDQNILLHGISGEDLTEKVSERVFQKIKPFLPQKDTEEYITRKEAAIILCISLPTLRKWTVDGRLISYRIGSSIRYKKSEISDSLKEVPSMKYRRAYL